MCHDGHGRGAQAPLGRNVSGVAQLHHAGYHRAVVLHPFLPRRFNVSEDAPNRVHQGQQGADNVRIQNESAVTQTAEQALAGVGNGFQTGEGEESAGALDGVKRAEDAGQAVAVPRLLLQDHQIAVELIQVLLAFDEELTDDVVLVVHPRPPQFHPPGACAGSVAAAFTLV